MYRCALWSSRLFLAAVVMLGVIPSLCAADQDEIDYISLATILIKDGHYDRAEDTLSRVDVNNEKIDRARFFTLSGLIKLRLGDYSEAKRQLNLAISNGQQDEVVHLYLSQALFGLKDHAGVLKQLTKAGEKAAGSPEMHIMAAQSNWMLQNRVAALASLDRGQKQFPNHAKFTRYKIFYLIEMGLYQQATDLGRAYLKHSEADIDDYIGIGRAFNQSGETDEAIGFLEKARLKYSTHKEVLLLLTQIYVKKGQLLAAALISRQLSDRYPQYRVDTAELYRRAGKLYQALTLNSQIDDQKKKLKQRLAILLELGHFEMASGMADDLHRVGLLNDDNLRYALAYAFFKSGDFEKAEDYLKRISSNDVFRKAAELRKTMESCRNARWKCY